MHSTDKNLFMLSINWLDLDGPDHRNYYHSPKVYKFEEPVWMIRFKIHMRGPKSGFRMGFHALAMYVQELTVMLKNKIMNMNDDDGTRLLAYADPERFVEGREINVQNDIPALAIGDGRELWVLKFNLHITHYIDDLCLSTKDGKMEEKTYITSYICTNPNHGKWVMHRNHLAKEWAIFNTNDNNMVITMVDDDKANTPSDHFETWASSTVNDSVHISKRAIERNEDCWMSHPGEKKVEFKLTYPWYTTID